MIAYPPYLVDLSASHTLISMQPERFRTFCPGLLISFLTGGPITSISTAANGQWQYSTDSNGGDQALGGTANWLLVFNGQTMTFESGDAAITWNIGFSGDLVNCIVSIDMQGQHASLSINDVVYTPATATWGSQICIPGGAVNMTIAADGGLGAVYLSHTLTYFDLNQSSNRQKFHNPDGSWVDINFDGSQVLGYPAEVSLLIDDPTDPTEFLHNNGWGKADFDTPFASDQLQIINLPPSVILPSAPTPPQWRRTDFQQGWLNLLPSGRVWPKHETSNLSQTILALVGTYQRHTASVVGDTCSAWGSAQRAADILRDTMPFWNTYGAGQGSIVELLPEWMLTLGLPSCSGEDTTLDQQVRQCVARFAGVGGQSIAFYTAYAQSLGYDNISISEYSPWRTDINTTDTSLIDQNAAFTWVIDTPAQNSWEFQTDVNHSDDALGGYVDSTLECELQRVKPAHTTLVVTYS